ncbi:hypothetical protein QJS04_geneDACA018412 [Acorus gramineus]|uniref:Uncharacterized protein n=1 Tax=Acorus gramineus TaxID=55184 RepID=A0AAV9AEY6_ACOGR|nr:hypothetical protein QJS04_geneDACA018412 [Acorus gramineus]
MMQPQLKNRCPDELKQSVELVTSDQVMKNEEHIFFGSKGMDLELLRGTYIYSNACTNALLRRYEVIKYERAKLTESIRARLGLHITNRPVSAQPESNGPSKDF